MVELLATTASSRVRSPVLTYEIVMVAKSEKFFPKFLVHIWVSFTNTAQAFLIKMEHKDSAPV